MSGYVLHACVAVAAQTEPGSPAAGLLSEGDAAFHVPSIFAAEVLSTLRGLVRGGKFDSAAAADLVVDQMVLSVDRWHLEDRDRDRGERYPFSRWRYRSASAAALAPHMPCTPGPGGVAAEQRYMPGMPSW